jgi:hypothetical protein
MDKKILSPLSLQAELSAMLHREARKRDYIVNDAIMVEKLSELSEKYTADWLSDEEFSSTFKGNMVGYYLGMCVNGLCGGLSCADAWADGDNRLDKIKYDEIYEGGVWNNVFVLLEMTDPNECKDFQNFIIELYEKWVVLMKDYFKENNATEYIIKTLSAFFQLGVSLRLDILGY